MKIGRLCRDEDGEYLVIPIDRYNEFWEDHRKAFKNYPIEQVQESGKVYQAYLNKWGEYMEAGYKDLYILMENPHLLLKLLSAASSALKSYMYGNQSPELAESVARKIDEYI